MYRYPTQEELDEMRWNRPGPDPIPGVAYEYGELYPGPMPVDNPPEEVDADLCPCPDCNI